MLDRERRRLHDTERDVVQTVEEDRPSPRPAPATRAAANRSWSTETSPVLRRDVRCEMEGAYAVGDEAPGGDNPTPDQDRVDDIGRALGIQYQDNEELNPDEKVRERDRHRWELDPASSEDWPHKDKK